MSGFNKHHKCKDVELEKRLLRVENVVGENVNQVEIKNDIEFPVEVKKIWEVDAEIRCVETEIIEDKVIVSGTIHKQVYFVAGEDAKVGGVHYKKGEVFEKTVEEEFTEFVDVPGASEDFDVDVDVRVEFVNHEKKKHKAHHKDDDWGHGHHDDDHDHHHDDDECDDDDHDHKKDCDDSDHHSKHQERGKDDHDHKHGRRDVWRQTVVLEIFVKVFEVVQLEIVTDVIAPDCDLEVVKELLKVESVIGEEEKQTEIIADIDFPHGTRVKKVKEVISEVRDIETEVIPDKVIVEGILHKQIIFVEKKTNKVFEMSVNEPFTVSVDVPGAKEGNDVRVDVDVEFVEVDLRHGNDHEGFKDARQTAILAVFVKVTEPLQIEVVVDVIGDDVEVERELLRVQGVVGENERQVNLKDEITIERPVKKIIETITDVKINRKDSHILKDKVIVEGILCKQIFYVDLCDEAVFEKSVKEKFTTFVDIPGARENGQTLDVDVEVEFVDHHLPDFPKWTCGAYKDGEYDPDDYPIDQHVVLAVFAKVTETLQLDVVVDVIAGEGPEPDDGCPEANIKIIIIQAGDTLFKIARRFHTTVEAILELNPGIEPNNLKVGQQIRVCAIEGPKG